MNTGRQEHKPRIICTIALKRHIEEKQISATDTQAGSPRAASHIYTSANQIILYLSVCGKCLCPDIDLFTILPHPLLYMFLRNHFMCL